MALLKSSWMNAAERVRLSHGCVVCLLAVLVAVVLSCRGACAQSVDEYQVKAAFLYNFAKFVEWPPQAFKTPADPISICILGANPFGNALEQAVKGKAVEGRSFTVRQISDLNPCHCHILFVTASERKHFRSKLGSLKASGVLTVGDSQGFAADGGIINLKLEDAKVRFEINVDAAVEEQLRISSKLLGLAQIVRR